MELQRPWTERLVARPTRRLGLVLAGGILSSTSGHVGVGGTTAFVVGGRAAAGVVGDTAGHVGVRGGTARVVLGLTSVIAALQRASAGGVLSSTLGHVGVGSGAAGIVLGLAVGGSQSTGGQSQGKEDVVDADHYGRVLVLE